MWRHLNMLIFFGLPRSARNETFSNGVEHDNTIMQKMSDSKESKTAATPGEPLRSEFTEDRGDESETVTRGTVTAQEWIGAWEEGRTGWHEGAPNSLLSKHLDKLVNGRVGITVFFPLCGKAVDMKLLYDSGHSVVGVDVAEQALKEFFSDNGLEYTVEPLEAEDGTLYRSKDGRVRLYCVDMFKFSNKLESGLEGVWDRGALVAINKEDRQKYVDLVVSLLSADGRYFLHSFSYDETKYPGPPHSLPREAVNLLYGAQCEVVEIETENLGTSAAWNLEELHTTLYLITPKPAAAAPEILSTKIKIPNFYHGNKEYTELKPSDWVGFWKENKTGLHTTYTQPFLVKHLDKLVNGRGAITIFVPLCGKSLDMKYLYDAGHSVIGLDIADEALKEFFDENKIEYTMETVDEISGHVYKSTDGRVRLYCADLFAFSSGVESGIQGLWDRGSYEAINVEERQRYVSQMMSLMADDCRYLLVTHNYDLQQYTGPPHTATQQHVNLSYGARCSVEKLESVDLVAMGDAIQKKKGVDWWHEELYLITWK